MSSPASTETTPRYSRLKERVVVGLLKLSACLPLGLSRVLGAGVGLMNVLLRTRMYTVTLENLELCFPHLSERERKRLARASLQETGKLMFEIGAMWLWDYRRVLNCILKVHNRELLDSALGQGQGVILLVPHLGNWEVMGPYLSDVSDVTFLYQPSQLPALDQIMRGSRERNGARLVPTNRKGVVALLKLVKSGGFTGILPDQVPNASGGQFAPFYGVPALTMTLVNNLRARTGCVVIAAYAKRVKGGFEVFFVEADPQIYAEDEGEALAAMNRTVEKCVDAIPEQYQWEYKRFRKQPAGMPKRYKSR